MAINVRFAGEAGEVAVLSNFARLMNDPRHFDAVHQIRDLIDGGCRRFVLEMGNVRETGATILGLLMTLTRPVRASGGEAVLANVERTMEKFLEEMRMDDYWDVFDDAEEASTFLAKLRMGDSPAGAD